MKKKQGKTDDELFVYHVEQIKYHTTEFVRLIRDCELKFGLSPLRESYGIPFEVCERIADEPDLPFSELVKLIQPMFDRAEDNRILSATDFDE